MSKESQRYYDVCCGAQDAARGNVCGKRIEDYDPPLTEHEREVYQEVYDFEKECMKKGQVSGVYFYPDID